MNVFRRIDDLGKIPGPLVLAAGVFDGMHHGHRAVLAAALSAAREMGGTAAALTFDPHPSKILRPDRASRLLTSTPHKLALMEEFGMQNVLVVPFTQAFAAIEAEAFLRQLCAAAPALRRVCVGRAWRFGSKRAGDGALLHRLGPELGFETTEVEPVEIDGAVISSTRIRQAVEEGDLDAAERLLGRRYTVAGTVCRGAGLGRQLGFPTANLSTHNEQFPPDGVYAVRVHFAGTDLSGVANIGVRPSVASNGDRLLEVYLFDFSGDLYDRDLEVKFVAFLRPEKRFPGKEVLQNQIREDAAHARRILAPE